LPPPKSIVSLVRRTAARSKGTTVLNLKTAN
jgi:hypothetical protein